MSISQRRFRYLSLQGVRAAPTAAEVLRSRANGVIPVFLLDANVCFQFMRVGDGKAPLNAFPEARQLLIDADTSGADIAAAFGLLELALDKPTHELDIAQYHARAEAVMRALHSSSPSVGAAGEQASFRSDASPDSAKAFLPMIRYLNGGLLKVLELTRRGLSAKVAVENLELLADWMDGTAQMVSPLLLQVGAAIFGGDTRVHPFLRINKKSSDPVVAARGAAWDLFYIAVMQMGTVVPLDSLRQDIILATDDQPLFRLAQHLAVVGMFTGLPAGDLPLVSFSTDYPHFRGKQDQLSRLSQRLVLAQASRATSRVAPPDPTAEVERLEAVIRATAA